MTQIGTDAQAKNALQIIARCSDPKQLARIADNALRLDQPTVRRAALLRLYAISPSAHPGTLEHDVWQSIFALEGALKEERGKTILLSRTRQKIKRDGEHQTVADLVLGNVSDGFRMLIDRGMPELTFEAVALRHQNEFKEEVLSAADKRLREFAINFRN
ncbi:hypothetical protein [Blastomonas sp.]|uniref:hypothetical protein n=1 Tax=Blastomonas sp. TaxID=1909299 RepID=UPI003593047F